MGDDARFTQEKVALLSVKANVPLLSKEAERTDPLLRDEKTRRVLLISTRRVFDPLSFFDPCFFDLLKLATAQLVKALAYILWL